MFNFDMVGWENFRLSGVVRVSVSDAFSYNDHASDFYSNFDPELSTGTDEVPWTTQMTDGIKGILNTYSQFANLTFSWAGDYDTNGSDRTVNPEDVGRAGVSDINISWINRTTANFSGISGGPNDQLLGYAGAAGDLFLNNAQVPFNFDTNSKASQTLIHELGHSLGLSHPHFAYDYNTNTPTLSADYAATQFLGFDQLGFSIKSAADMNKEYFTVMSYDDQASTLPNSGYVYNSYTPMILDIIALQQAYGEGSGTSGSGNDTISIGTAGYRTYFDAGGFDTVDLTSYADAAHLNMGVPITGAAHLVGVAMSAFDALNTIVDGGNPANLRWLYGEYENAIGSASDDLIIGNSLANVIDGRSGDDYLDGGPGKDTAAYSAALTHYIVSKTPTGYTVTDKTGTDGTDTLTSIEALRFTDKSINLQIQAQAASAPAADVVRLMELYVAFFNRTPDADGLSYWITQKVGGQTIYQIAESFYSAGVQFSNLTGFSSTMSNTAFVNVVYKNVLGRADGGDAQGVAYWSGKLADGSASRGALVSTILDSAHTYKGDASFGYVADLLDNKIAVAKTIAIDYGLNYNSADEAVSSGMAIASAVTPTSIAPAIALIGVNGFDLHLG